MLLIDFPVELFLDHILPALPLPALLALASTNKHFSQLCNDDTFWKLRLHTDYNFTPNADTARESGWKIIYKGIRKPSVYTWGAAGQGRLGLSKTPAGVDKRASGVPFPAKVDIDARIVSLSAGGWSFNALDDLGNIHVWGQLDGGAYAFNNDGFSEACKSARVPHRLQLTQAGSKNPVKFTSVSCGRAHSAALDSEHNAWAFTTWGRPVLLTSHFLTDVHDPITQVESGWGFVSMLTAGGSVFVSWPFTEGEDFERHLRVANEELNEGPNAEEAKAVAQDRVIPCTSISIPVDPIALPPIPDNLPELTYTTDAKAVSFEVTIDASGKVVETASDKEVRLVRIGAGDNFIIGLTNRGHVLCIDLSHGADGAPWGSVWLKNQWASKRRAGWVYLPEYSEVRAVGLNPIFTGDGMKTDVETPPAPTKLRITHITAHFNTFVAYSVASATAPSASLVLIGNKSPSTTPNSEWDFEFRQIIHPALLANSIISLTLGDYHNAALTSSGKLLTWGAYSDGALGLGNPKQLPAGVPGGYATEQNRLMANDDRFWDDPPEVHVPTEVKFDVAANGAPTNAAGRKFVVSVAAAGWHTGALVIDLDGADEGGGQQVHAMEEEEEEEEEDEDDEVESMPHIRGHPPAVNGSLPGFPQNWPHPPAPPNASDDPFHTYQTPGFNPRPRGGSGDDASGVAVDDSMRAFETPGFNPGPSSGGPPYPLPQPPFTTSGPGQQIHHGPFIPSLGFAARGGIFGGAGRGGAQPYGMRGVPHEVPLGHRPAPPRDWRNAGTGEPSNGLGGSAS